MRNSAIDHSPYCFGDLRRHGDGRFFKVLGIGHGHFGAAEAFDRLINANFDLRAKIYQIAERNLEMIETARRVGVSAKFSGSGGAIVGTYKDEATYQKLQAALEAARKIVDKVPPELASDKNIWALYETFLSQPYFVMVRVGTPTKLS